MEENTNDQAGNTQPMVLAELKIVKFANGQIGLVGDEPLNLDTTLGLLETAKLIAQMKHGQRQQQAAADARLAQAIVNGHARR